MSERPMRGGVRRPRSLGIEIFVRASGVEHAGLLSVPERSRGLVLFAHGSGSGRRSPRNRHVADVLNEGGIATLLVDLLTAREDAADEGTGRFRFDIDLLAERVAFIIDSIASDGAMARLPLGLFGASTGAAAALRASAVRPGRVAALVSRGGRPDLAGPALPLVTAPTLLIVGGCDEPVIEMNRAAESALRCTARVVIVPGATHLFEEEGALDSVARLARRWFTRHFRRY